MASESYAVPCSRRWAYGPQHKCSRCGRVSSSAAVLHSGDVCDDQGEKYWLCEWCMDRLDEWVSQGAEEAT